MRGVVVDPYKQVGTALGGILSEQGQREPHQSRDSLFMNDAATATAALGELRKAGIIAIDRKQIRIIDRERLERAARE